MLPKRHYIETLVKQVSSEEILPRYHHTGFEIKSDGSLLTEADMGVDRRLHQILTTQYPDIAFLSEEMTEEQQESIIASADYWWCLDPLDGTSNFVAGLPLFATSLALIGHGEVLQAYTYDPLRDEMFSAEKGKGAWLNGQVMKLHSDVEELSQAIALVDMKRLPRYLKERLCLQSPYRSQRNLGSCVLEWAWLAANRGHLYLHGGMKLWDLAAGTLILSEAGGYASTLQGDCVFQAGLKVQSVVIANNAVLFDKWHQYLSNN